MPEEEEEEEEEEMEQQRWTAFHLSPFFLL
jgi:hypothetical protein